MITLAGLSHHDTPLQVREQFAIASDDVPRLLRSAHDRFGTGAALLSTCNRFELYLGGEHGASEVQDFLAESLGREPSIVRKYVHLLQGREAVRHLYAVASGIDSMVVGETEILGQVRTAFSATVSNGVDDTVVSRLFHTAIRVGRRVRNETALSDRALSVSSIAAQQARAALGDLTEVPVLVIGAGEAGRLTAMALAGQGARRMMVSNRSRERAETLAEDLGAEVVDFADLEDALIGAQVVVGASGSPEALLSLERCAAVMGRREGAPLLIIDIGMPRDFDPRVRRLGGVTYFDLDDLQGRSEQNAAAREREIESATAIVEAETDAFADWLAHLQVAPTIAALSERAEAVRRAELARTQRRLRLDDRDRAHVEELWETLTRSLVKRLLSDPILVLRERRDDAEFVELTRTLFRLPPDEPPDDPPDDDARRPAE